MYKIKLKVGNRTFTGFLPGDDLTESEIQSRGMAAFQPAIQFAKASIKLSKKEIVKGKDVETTIVENGKIEWEKVVEEKDEGVQKVYEIADVSKLTREELIEQQILLKKKAEKIQNALDKLAQKELEEIEARLKENENGG